MSLSKYKHVVCRKREGAHYTPKILAEFVANNIVKSAQLSKKIRIVDPAIGDGELILSLLSALQGHVESVEVYGFDTNRKSIEITKSRIQEKFADVEPKLYHKDFLQFCLERDGMSQSEKKSIPDFDLLIANPPYIRTQVLGAQQAQLLRKDFGLKGKVDIYHAFLVAIQSVLKPKGVAGVIVSNRFITTKGGGKLREALFEQYHIKHIWDFGDTKLFEASVLPAVILMSPSKEGTNSHVEFTSIYEHDCNNDKDSAPIALNPIHALSFTGLVNCENERCYNVRHGVLTFDTRPSDVWRLQDDMSEKWLKKVVQHSWATFKDVGKIRVGVKTTADSVFIKSDWKNDLGFEPELLKPLTTHHVAGKFKKSDIPLKSILYTHHVENGQRKVIDINNYPLSKRYLDVHYEKLSSRKYVIDAGRKWYELWVPQNPALWEQPKIIFRDISEKPTFWMDLDHTVANGDCYWMVCDHNNLPKDILWLVLAVANSDFIEEFYDIKFKNKLYSNRRRFITQYVEQFPIPDPSSSISGELIKIAKQLYDKTAANEQPQLLDRINRLTRESFGLR